jgi:hypothetical protein
MDQLDDNLLKEYADKFFGFGKLIEGFDELDGKWIVDADIRF